ncbi:hypothetical protein HJ150_15690 [Vibrio parahaemolyticus]|nr:hypothetical protein [Vibrio parahaemolyticus]
MNEAVAQLVLDSILDDNGVPMSQSVKPKELLAVKTMTSIESAIRVITAVNYMAEGSEEAAKKRLEDDPALRYCFQLGELLGVLDPREIHRKADSELIALWRAHFLLKSEQEGNPPPRPSKPKTPTVIDLSDTDKQVAACERFLM